MPGKSKQRKQILIIDDEEMILDILKRRFERMGFDVKTAEDGAAGVKALGNHIFDLIICDLRMPHCENSTDILQLSRVHMPACKFVYMSGQLLSEQHIADILNNGADMFLKKPFSSLAKTTQQLADLIR